MGHINDFSVEHWPSERSYMEDNTAFHITNWLEDVRLKSWVAPKPVPIGTLRHKKAIRLLEQKVANMKILEQQVNILRMEITKDQVALSPIRRMPPEILSKIFCMIAEDDWNFPSVEPCSRLVPTPRFTASKSIILLVCRLWRDLAMATPSFWVHIRLGHHLPINLLYSKNTHIHLNSRSLECHEALKRFAKIFEPHSLRVETIDDRARYSIFLMTSTLPGTTWDNLVYLRLIRDYWRQNFSSTVIVLPKLRKLYINNCIFDWLPRFIHPKLENLTLISVISSFSQLIHMMKSALGLRVLKVIMDDFRSFRGGELKRDMTHSFRLALSKLEFLKVGGSWPCHAILPFCSVLKGLKLIPGRFDQQVPPRGVVLNDSVQTFSLSTARAEKAAKKHLVPWWQAWLMALPSLSRIDVINNVINNEGFWADNYPAVVAELFVTLSPPSSEDRQGLPLNQTIKFPTLSDIYLESVHVELLPLLTFANRCLKNDKQENTHEQIPISNMVQMRLRLSKCTIFEAQNEEKGLGGLDQPHSRNLTLSTTLNTWHDFEDNIRVYPYPELTELGWEIQFPDNFQPDDCVVLFSFPKDTGRQPMPKVESRYDWRRGF